MPYALCSMPHAPKGESEGRARELSGKEIIILLCVEKIFAMGVSLYLIVPIVNILQR